MMRQDSMSKLTSPMVRRVWSRKPAMKRRKRQTSAKFVARPIEARMAPALLWPRSCTKRRKLSRVISAPMVKPARMRVCGPVDADHRAAIGVAQREQLLQQPSRKATHTFRDRLDADRLQVEQTDFHGGAGGIVSSAVLERGFVL